jgi:hypothetical protein
MENEDFASLLASLARSARFCVEQQAAGVDELASTPAQNAAATTQMQINARRGIFFLHSAATQLL